MKGKKRASEKGASSSYLGPRGVEGGAEGVRVARDVVPVVREVVAEVAPRQREAAGDAVHQRAAGERETRGREKGEWR